MGLDLLYYSLLREEYHLSPRSSTYYTQLLLWKLLEETVSNLDHVSTTCLI